MNLEQEYNEGCPQDKIPSAKFPTCKEDYKVFSVHRSIDTDNVIQGGWGPSKLLAVHVSTVHIVLAV